MFDKLDYFRLYTSVRYCHILDRDNVHYIASSYCRSQQQYNDTLIAVANTSINL